MSLLLFFGLYFLGIVLIQNYYEDTKFFTDIWRSLLIVLFTAFGTAVLFVAGLIITSYDLRIVAVGASVIAGLSGTYILYRFFFKRKEIAYKIAFTVAILSGAVLLVTVPSSVFINDFYSTPDLIDDFGPSLVDQFGGDKIKEMTGGLSTGEFLKQHNITLSDAIVKWQSGGFK